MYELTEGEEPTGRERPNKSQLKREAQFLLALAKTLTELRDEQYADLALPESVLEALSDLREMRQFGAKKRQLKLIAKLLRDVDMSKAQQVIAQLDRTHAETNAAFHHIEQWRARLLAGDAAVLTTFIQQYPDVDMQYLRRLVANAKVEARQRKPPKSSRLLFKLLKALLEDR